MAQGQVVGVACALIGIVILLRMKWFIASTARSRSRSEQRMSALSTPKGYEQQYQVAKISVPLAGLFFLIFGIAVFLRS